MNARVTQTVTGRYVTVIITQTRTNLVGYYRTADEAYSAGELAQLNYLTDTAAEEYVGMIW